MPNNGENISEKFKNPKLDVVQLEDTTTKYKKISVYDTLSKGLSKCNVYRNIVKKINCEIRRYI